jgi:hypothetical protein
VADASILATWAGTAANCGGREQPDPKNSPNMMNIDKTAVQTLIHCQLFGVVGAKCLLMTDTHFLAQKVAVHFHTPPPCFYPYFA